jgi:hypothetical protein
LDTVNLCIPTRSKTILLLLCMISSRSVLQPGVFLLPMQSVGALTSFIKIVCLLTDISQSFQSKYLFSFLVYLFCKIVFLI